MSASASRRYYELDLFRFLAALAVVFFHYGYRGHAGADGLSDLSFPALAPISKYGLLGVDFFFMISGFVILMSAARTDLSGFVISRVTRLYPAFWAGATLTAVTTALISDERFHVGLAQYLANLSMISGFLGVPPVDGVYWTLLVELKFYCLIAGLLLLRAMHRMPWFLSAWLAITAANTAWPLPKLLHVMFFPDWSSYFIAGAAFYSISQQRRSPAHWGIVAGAYGLSLRYGLVRAAHSQEVFHEPFPAVVTCGLITLFYAAFALLALDRLKPLQQRAFLFVGALTYPLYLIHQNIGFMIFNRVGTEQNKYVVLAATIGLMLGLSYLIHAQIERRFAGPFKNLLLRGHGTIIAPLAACRPFWLKPQVEPQAFPPPYPAGV